MNVSKKQKEELNPTLWSKLPNDSLLEIVARLPVRSLAQYRTVSKTWDASIGGMWECDPHSSLLPSRLKANAIADENDKYCFVYDLSRCNSYYLGINGKHSFDFLTAYYGIVERVVATCQGLLLCSNDGDYDQYHQLDPSDVEYGITEQHFIVCNPLKIDCCKHLPKRIGTWAIQGVGIIITDNHTSAFKVVLANWISNNVLPDARASADKIQFEIYDSADKCWDMFECKVPIARLTWEHTYHSGICHKKFMLFVGKFSLEILVYDFERNMWRSIQLPRVTHHNQLESYGGRLFLMGQEYSGKNHLRVWEFQETGQHGLYGFWVAIPISLSHNFPTPKRQISNPILTYFHFYEIGVVVVNIAEKTWQKNTEEVKEWLALDGRIWTSLTELDYCCGLEEDYWMDCSLQEKECAGYLAFTPRLESCACSSICT